MQSQTNLQKHLVIYFQVHQPLRLANFRFFDIGSGKPYLNDSLNQDILERIARECYLPTNMLLLKLIKNYPQIKLVFSVSGLALDQMEEYTPEVLASFRALAQTGAVEFLAETQYHSLACMIPGDEFEQQVIDHAKKLQRLLGVKPKSFRNTELIYSDDIGRRVHALGFKAVFCDGLEKILGTQSPHHLYQHPDKDLHLLLRNYRLSDDIAFRFKQGNELLTVQKYISWLDNIPENETLVTLALDYETFGEHQKRATGILSFLEDLLVNLAHHPVYRMATSTEVIRKEKVKSRLSVPVLVSWADRERDLSAWLGNVIQQDAFDTLLSLEHKVKALEDKELLTRWRTLQTSDHFYYMSTKKDDDGNVHAYFSPYPSPYEAFINYMNILSDFTLEVNKRLNAIPTRKQAEIETAQSMM
ncbi:MAG TPA: glycoside hydrolase family 57 protein [Ohtaekwangia sp.]|nr:glycoside hydrolase family 57 protein [Ohtaekwangia sp.]